MNTSYDVSHIQKINDLVHIKCQSTIKKFTEEVGISNGKNLLALPRNFDNKIEIFRQLIEQTMKTPQLNAKF